MHNDEISTTSVVKWTSIILVLLVGAVWFIQGNDFFLYRTFAPKYEEARREVFEQTPSYVQGKNTYLARLRMQYETADEGHKESLRQLILSEAETIDTDNLTESNQIFVESLRKPAEESR